MQHADLARWIDRYERAWRTTGTDTLSEVFTPGVTYRPSPWHEPLRGLSALSAFWDAERNGPDERFTLRYSVVACEGDVGVARVEVHYAQGTRWRDLWIVRLGEDGRCLAFEEWPFTTDQPDGHAGASR